MERYSFGSVRHIGGRSLAALAALAGAFSVASASEVLWNNGPWITHPGGGAGGLDASLLQSGALSLNIIGFGVNATNRLADDFEITDPLGWDIQQIETYGYQTNATTSTLTGMNWKVWDNTGTGGNGPGFGANVEEDRSGSNQGNVFDLSSVYRVTETTGLLNNARRIQRAVDNVNSAFTLGNGIHWLDYQITGTSASGPFCHPTTVLGQLNSIKLQGARQYSVTSNLWAYVADAGVGSAYSANPIIQDIPFVIRGLTLTIKVSGNVQFQDKDEFAPPIPNCEMEVRDTGTTNVLKSLPVVSLDANGNFTISTNPVSRGVYDLAIRRDGFLRKVVTFNTTMSNPNVGSVSLINGDADPDNEVNLVDGGAISAAFGSVDGDPNWNPLADLNCDGEVNLVDWGIFSANYGLAGDD